MSDLSNLDWPVLVIGDEALAPHAWEPDIGKASYRIIINDAFVRDGTPVGVWTRQGDRDRYVPLSMPPPVMYLGDYLTLQVDPVGIPPHGPGSAADPWLE